MERSVRARRTSCRRGAQVSPCATHYTSSGPTGRRKELGRLPVRPIRYVRFLVSHSRVAGLKGGWISGAEPRYASLPFASLVSPLCVSRRLALQCPARALSWYGRCFSPLLISIRLCQYERFVCCVLGRVLTTGSPRRQPRPGVIMRIGELHGAMVRKSVVRH